MKSRPNNTTVIGVDPGLAALGYGIILNKRGVLCYIADGTIRTPPQMTTGERLQYIFTELQLVLERFQPTHASIETLFFAKNSTSALPVAQVMGVIYLLFQMHAIQVMNVRPQQVKQIITDYGRANKERVKEMVQLLLNYQLRHRCTTHSVDGLAIAIAGQSLAAVPAALGTSA